ncbi:hypothetical protein N566_00900 [Streptomycetaceae bacterium MP113-05]|nr:hypothetical protein N566_00900 [Streptomycetaceae bacterium MP113-05]
MSRASHNGGHAEVSAQELRAEVEHAREELADTVSQLAAKADVTARAQQKARDARARIQHQGRHAAGQGEGKRGVVLAAGGGVLVLAVLVALLHKRRRT